MSEHGESTQLAQAETLVDSGIAVVKLTGEVDMTNAQDTRSVLQAQLDARPDVLIVDLAVGFFGSAGLATLVEAHQRAEHDHVAFAVVASERPARRPIEISGLQDAFPLYSTVEEAVEALRKSV